jgi:PST family polysaccharide transporter/lipopolysaccharide exporter
MSLRDRTARNIGIVAVLQVFATAVNAITLIVLANLLTPYDFGIVGIAGFVLGIIGQFSDFGLGPAVIQRQKDTEEAHYTGGAIRILIALALFIFAFLTADVAAWIFNSDEVVNVIRVSAVMFFLTSAGFVSTTRLTKELKFGKLAIVTVVISLVSASSSLTIAWITRTYWAMIVGPIIGTSIGLIALYIVSPWKARFHIDRRIAKELLGYGKHIFLMLFFVFLIFHLDDAFVGAFLGLTVLGYYFVAYKWSSFFANFLVKLVYKVMFPTYSQIQEAPSKLKRGYLETLEMLSLAAFPLYLALVVLAPEFVSMLLGDKWLPAVLSLQILCFFGLARTLTEPAGNMFMATGKARVLSMTNLLNFIIIAIFIYPATVSFGIEGVSFLVVMMLFSHMIILWWLVTKNFDISFGEIGETFRGPMLSSILMFTAMLILKSMLGPGLVPFLATLALGGVVYVGVIYRYEGERIKYYWREFRRLLARSRS